MTDIKYEDIKKFSEIVADYCDNYHVNSFEDLKEVFKWECFCVVVELVEGSTDLRDARVAVYDDKGKYIVGSPVGLWYEIDAGCILRRLIDYLENH